ncbi:MAG TPA: hypothetical protein VJ124_25485 [Pyrinomonadaceae bacterium]|nr:hypothetical protein [Pyrinomonadaceae bacterium]
MKKSLFGAVLLAMACVGISLAQDKVAEIPGPPKVLLVVREDIKPGQMAAHSRHSEAYAGIFAKNDLPNHRIALVPVAGSENEVIYLTGGETFAEIEKTLKDTDMKMASLSVSMKGEMDRLNKEAPDLHSGMRDMLTVFRPELSYNPSVVIPQMRYFAVTTVSIRPGQDAQYADYVKSIINTARDKAKAELHVAAFQVVAGSPGSTYLFFRPMKSLAEYDLRIGPRVREAMSEDDRKKADKMASESILFTETSIYAFDPRMSYVTKEFAAADPTFWNARTERTAMTPRRPARRPAPKPNQ